MGRRNMKNINLTTARKICDEAKADGVLIIGITDGAIKSVAWGKNAIECKRYGIMLDTIVDKLESGEILL